LTELRRPGPRAGPTEQVKLYGRDGVLARIAVPGTASVIIVTGDSDSDKSAVLGRAAELDVEQRLGAGDADRGHWCPPCYDRDEVMCSGSRRRGHGPQSGGHHP
jgi:hypothetical protein